MKDFKDIEVTESDFFLVYPLYNEMTQDELNSEFNEIYGKLYNDIKLILEAKGLIYTKLRAVDKYKLSEDEVKTLLDKSTALIIPKLDAKEDEFYKSLIKDYNKAIYLY